MNKDEELQKKVVDKFESELKKNYIKNIMIGFESANKMIIDYIDSGHSIEEVRDFCEKNLKKRNQNIIKKVAK